MLLSDIEAEHVPGCNMAFRREALAAIDGFDARYRAAGDDVDLCWRLQERGGKIGFHAGAMVWHHRRNSLKMYWNQQKGYGKAEALLEEKWPERYNPMGHLAWGGRLYGRGFTLPIPFGRSRVYGGVWGSAAYQALYEPGSVTLLSLPLMPEWVYVIAGLAVLSLLGLSWSPLLWFVPLLLLAVAAPVAQAAIAATRAQFPVPAGSAGEKAQRWVVTFAMHLMQPMARLIGRIKHGLTPWRRRGVAVAASSSAKAPRTIWSETWRSSEEWVEMLEAAAREQGAIVRRGGDFDDWDLEVRGGLFGGLRAVVAVEEHGAGKQFVRLAAGGRVPPLTRVSLALLAVLAVGALAGAAWVACLILVGLAAGLTFASARDVRAAERCWAGAVTGAQPGGAGPSNRLGVQGRPAEPAAG